METYKYEKATQIEIKRLHQVCRRLQYPPTVVELLENLLYAVESLPDSEYKKLQEITSIGAENFITLNAKTIQFWTETAGCGTEE